MGRVGTLLGSLGCKQCGSGGEGWPAEGPGRGEEALGSPVAGGHQVQEVEPHVGGRPGTDWGCLGASRTTQTSQGTRGSHCLGWAVNGGAVGVPAPLGPALSGSRGTLFRSWQDFTAKSNKSPIWKNIPCPRKGHGCPR